MAAPTSSRSNLLTRMLDRPRFPATVICVAACCLVFTVLLVLRTKVLDPSDPVRWANPYDHHKYIYLAQHPVGSFHINPPCWRIAVPFLVGLLPAPTITAYKIQASVLVVATGVLLYVFLHRAAGYTAGESFLGLVLYYSYGPATKLMIQGPYSPDPAIFTILVIALLCLYRRHDVLLAITLTTGAAVKETIILLIPLIYTIRATRLIDIRLLVRTVLIGAPALAVLLTIRSLIPAYNDVDSYVSQTGPQLTQVHLGTAKFSYRDALQRVTRARLQDTPVNIVRDLTYGSVGLLWLLPFFALAHREPATRDASPPSPAASSNSELLFRFLPFFALTYFGWFLALNTDRRFAFAFPFLIMMGLNGLKHLAGGWNLNVLWFVPVFLLQYLLNLLQPQAPAVPFDVTAATFLLCLGLLYSFRERLPVSR